MNYSINRANGLHKLVAVVNVWSEHETILSVTITISPISIFIAVQRHSLTMWPQNSSGFDRTPSRFPFESRRWYRRISGELYTVDLPQPTLSTSSSEIGNTFYPPDWVPLADTSASVRPSLGLESRFSVIFADRSFRGSHVCERQIWYYGNLISPNSAISFAKRSAPEERLFED